MNLAWQTTRNTFEAACLSALDIPVRGVHMLDHKTGQRFTRWNLQRDNSVPEGENPPANFRPFVTGQIRNDWNNGKPIGELAATPLHPFLIAARTMHNRQRLLDAQKGKTMRLVEAAPGSWMLEPGPPSQLLHGEFWFDTPDIDLAVALITIGCALITITSNGNTHVYRLTRFSRSPSLPISPSPSFDSGDLKDALRSNALFPARRWEPFAIAIHVQHCLRELRRNQEGQQWIVVRHRTFDVKGAAFRADASSEEKLAVQNKLQVRITA